MDPQPPPPQEEDLDALRRRLYRVGATEADVQRYVRERGEQTPAPDEPAEQTAVRVVPRRALGAAVVVLAAAIALILTQQSREPEPAGPAGPSQQVQAIGDGRVLAVGTGDVSAAVDAATSVRGVAAVGQRYTGHGNAVVAFDPPAAAAQGARAMVVLTSGSSTPVAWRALLTRTPDGRTSSQLVVLAKGRTQAPWGMAGPTVFDCPVGPPTRIAVEAPDDAAWTLLVAATDGVEPDLH